jgi:hypothetical protein
MSSKRCMRSKYYVMTVFHYANVTNLNGTNQGFVAE